MALQTKARWQIIIRKVLVSFFILYYTKGSFILLAFLIKSLHNLWDFKDWFLYFIYNMKIMNIAIFINYLLYDTCGKIEHVWLVSFMCTFRLKNIFLYNFNYIWSKVLTQWKFAKYIIFWHGIYVHVCRFFFIFKS